jgi:cobalamin biosynthesis protein CbiD
MSKAKAMIAVVAVATALAGPLAVPSQAATRAKVTTGSCSGASTWKLTLKWDAGRVESDVEVQTPVAGQQWKSVFKDNGTVFARARKTTAGDGSFSVTRFATNQAGADHIRVKSTNVTTGETCKALGAL